ncbi:MFS transporter [Halostella sp. JP-L12]|uniref:MFS transporter n=1 Tax=Halostella TaxID=1843185 RepID=UPI000EF82314|nr:MULTISPECIES: MFS transporter [Halostella]NHN49105.1 MFS transporter [Halostella sp. JP-L12]
MSPPRERADATDSSGALRTVLACSLVGIMGVPLISPLLPTLRSVFGVGDAGAGLLITAYTLPGVFLTPFVGLLSDRLGRRAVVLPLLFLFGVAGGAIALAPPFRVVLLLRFLQGVGGSGLMVLAVTLIGDFYDGQRRDAAMGTNGSAIGVAAAAYPLLGGALAGVRWNAPFAFFGVGIAAGAVAFVTLEEPEIGDPPAFGRYLRRMAAAVLVPKALSLWAAAFLTFFLFYGGVLTALSLLLSDVYGLSPGRIGLLFGAVSVANASMASQYGRVSHRFEPEELIALGFAAFGISLLGVRAAPSIAAVGGMLLCFGLGFGLVMPSLNTTAAGLVPGQLRAGTLGVLTSTLWLGQTVGPVAFTGVAGLAFEDAVAGYRFLLLFWGAASLAVGLPLFLALVRRD